MQGLVKQIRKVFYDNDYAFCKRLARGIVKGICKKHKTTEEQFFNEVFSISLVEKFKQAKIDGTDRIYKNFYYDWIIEHYNKNEEEED